MGHEYLQVIACGNLTGLSPTAFRILLRMAAVVRDDDDIENGQLEGLYYGGWKALTPVLGYSVHSKRDPLPKHVERRIARGIAELKAAGYLLDAPDWIQDSHSTRVYRLDIRDIPIV